MQVQGAPGRKLFDEVAKKAFLDHFAETCNATASARAVGFDYRTAFRHRRDDPVFGAAWEEALAFGYVQLEELALREAKRTLGWEPPEPSGEVSQQLRLDPAMALQLLREHKRGAGRVPKPGREPGVADNDQVMDALIKRLKAFGVRIGRDGERLDPAGSK